MGKKLKYTVSAVFVIALLLIIGKIKAFNYSTSKIRVYSAADGKKICVRSDILKQENAYNMYLWTSFNNNKPLTAWPGVAMQKEKDDIYCYTHTADGEAYDYVIFNGGSKQTVDLSMIDDEAQLINTFIYQFDNSNMVDGKYIGAWYVYDTSKLVEIVDAAKGLDGKKYTINSYNNVLDALGNGVNDSKADFISKANIDNDPENKLIVKYENNTYSSEYIDAYNTLATAMNNLVERKKIVVNNQINGGTLTAKYANNSDTSISINPKESLGYKLKKLTVKKIVSYDSNNNPVFGDETDIDINSTNYNYTFDESEYTTNNMVGLYFDAEFAKKTYKLKFVVGENGKITTTLDGEVVSPVTVEYDDDYTIKIKANKGYEVSKVLINGKEYHLTSGVLTVKNIKEDTDVEISFKLKTYTIKVDGQDYKYNYNTTYDEIISSLGLDKNKDFLYLKDKDGNKLTESYKVEKDDELTSVYKEKKEESKSDEESSTKDNTQTKESKQVKNNPLTSDSIIKNILVFGIALNFIIVLISVFLKRTEKKKM